jgi:hypothetical protein
VSSLHKKEKEGKKEMILAMTVIMFLGKLMTPAMSWWWVAAPYLLYYGGICIGYFGAAMAGFLVFCYSLWRSRKRREPDDG